MFFFFDKGRTVTSEVNRYWVSGGTGNTNSTTNWSLTSGGASGASVPTTGVNAIWDGNSGNGTVTFNATFTCKDFDSTNFTGTLAGSSARNVGGKYIIGAGCTPSMTGTTTLNATTSGIKEVNTNGKSLAHNITFNGSGDSWSSSNITTSGTITATNGSPDFTSKTITCAIWSAAAASTPVFTGSTINNTGNFTGGSKTYSDVNTALSTTSISVVTGSNTFINYALTNSAAYTGATLVAGTTNTINGVYTVTGHNASTERLYVRSDTNGTAANLTLNGSASIANADYEDIAATGTATPITGTLIGDCGRIPGITPTTPITATWAHPATASQTPFDPNWGASRVPIPQDLMLFGASSFSTTGLTVAFNNNGGAGRFSAQNWTGATNSPTADFSVAGTFYGSMTFIAGMTLTGIATQVMAGDRAMTITSAGQTIPFPLSVNCLNGSVTLQDAYTIASDLKLFGGTFDANDFAVTLTQGSFASSGSIARTLTMGSGTWILANNGILWNVSGTNLTVNGETSTIKFTNNSGTAKQFIGGSFTYYNIWNATAGAGTLIINSSNTFNDFKSDASRITEFAAGSTTTLQSLTLGINCTIRSTTASQAIIANASGVAFAATGTTVTNMNVTGAGLIVTGGVNGGGNTGVTFI